MRRTLSAVLVVLLALSLFTGAGLRKEVTWEDYQQWLVDNLAAISPFPEPVSAIVWETESWEEIEAGYDSGPWGKFFDEDCYNASTWEEFVAAGGVGTFNADFVDLPMGPDADSGSSGEASDEASDEASGESITVTADGRIDGVDAEHVSLIVNGAEIALTPGSYNGQVVITEEYSVTASGGSGEPPAGGGGPGGASGGSGETGEKTVGELTRTVLGTELITTKGATDYRTALYVDEAGVRDEYSVTEAVSGGSFDGERAQNVSITGGSDTFSALVVEGVPYTLSGADIDLNSQSAGGHTNDFTGLGAAVSAYGEGTVLTIENSDIETGGVVKPALYISGGADVIVRNSRLAALGGEVYGTYLSNANQTGMIGAPWHLGINNARGNSRCINLMGKGTTETVIDSEVYAAGWGALSVDDGSYMRMDVVNSTVDVDEGYGAFAIAQITENYYGVDMNAGVLDFIMMGGHVNIGSYTGGDEIDIRRMQVKGDGEGIDTYYAEEGDELVATVSSEAVPAGETVRSTISSERFGFEMHSMMLNDTVNTITLKEGTALETGEAAFIVKSGFADITIDDASVTVGESPYTGERVLLQLMDNDDGFCGLTNFQYSTFGEYFWEPDGWSFEFADTIDTDDFDLQGSAGYDVRDYGDVACKSLDPWWTNLTLENTAIEGDVWNSTGYWTQGGSALSVTIGEGARLTGVISSGAYQHYAKTYEVGLYGFYGASGSDSVPLEENAWYNSENSGSWENAKYISVVANTPYYYGANDTAVTVSDGGVWDVTGACLLTELRVDGGTVNGLGGIYELTLSVAGLDNQVDAVTVERCTAVDWVGGDIDLAAANNTTVYLLLPEGAEVSDYARAGESLGIGAKEFEGQYFGSFYVPGQGLLAEPLDIY